MTADDTRTNDAPILEFDPTREAMLEPTRLIRRADVPERAVLCFFQDVIDILVERHEAKVIKRLRSEIGRNPVYEIALRGQRLAVVHPGVGAPLAGGFLEEVIALGCRSFIACGGAGVLDSAIAVGHVLVPTSAVRDDGTSYHYLPPSREVSADSLAVAAIEQALTEHQVEYLLCKTWTTDAIYRETPEKIKRRRAEGCLTVEMESAAFFAIAAFRDVRFGQILYGGDDVGSEEWSSREWNSHASVREKLFWLAADACLLL